MKIFAFRRGSWDPAEMPLTFSPHMCKDFTAVLLQEEDCIVNSFNKSLGDYDYIGIAMTEPTVGDCTVTTHCSFEKFGAPLIVLADGIRTEGAYRLYGAIYEIVAYEEGCNVWRILPEPDPEKSERRYTVRKIAHKPFFVEAGTTLEMSVRVHGKHAFVTVNDYSFDVALPDLPDAYYVGLTACEGINRFYDLTVE